ncbi:MAG: hypothetical protein QOG43_399 [Actinomycetota bacterium]|nr:hypothetical protein [Actinomycetota bacterium]
MRKFTILGLGALSTIAISVGPLSHVGATAPTPLADEVCAALPSGISTVNNLLSDNADQVADLESVLSTADANLSQTTLDLVDALIEHIHSLDAGGAGSVPLVNARVGTYSDAVVAWLAAWDELDAAKIQGRILGVSADLYSGLHDVGSGLCPVPVTTTTTTTPPATTTTTSPPGTTTTTDPSTTTTSITLPVTTTSITLG